jgi:uncharacterized protein
MDADRYQPTERTKLRRLPERGAYDRQTVRAILDEGFVCHVGFVADGQPYVIPTGYARVGDTIYLHGSSGSRLGLRPGMDVCVTVTLLDGRSWPARPSTLLTMVYDTTPGKPHDQRI